jgi:hypothetical protein
MKSGRLRWTGHVGRWERREIYLRFLAGESEGNHHLEGICSLQLNFQDIKEEDVAMTST